MQRKIQNYFKNAKIKKENEEKKRLEGDDFIAVAAQGHLGFVRQLLNRNVNINYTHSQTGNTALIAASREGKLDVVNLLLDSKAEINLASNGCRRTALIQAIKHKHLDVVNELLDNKADISQSDMFDNPINLAAKSSNPALMKALLFKKANINQLDGYGRTPSSSKDYDYAANLQIFKHPFS